MFTAASCTIASKSIRSGCYVLQRFSVLCKALMCLWPHPNNCVQEHALWLLRVGSGCTLSAAERHVLKTRFRHTFYHASLIWCHCLHLFFHVVFVASVAAKGNMVWFVRVLTSVALSALGVPFMATAITLIKATLDPTSCTTKNGIASPLSAQQPSITV